MLHKSSSRGPSKPHSSKLAKTPMVQSEKSGPALQKNGLQVRRWTTRRHGTKVKRCREFWGAPRKTRNNSGFCTLGAHSSDMNQTYVILVKSTNSIKSKSSLTFDDKLNPNKNIPKMLRPLLQKKTTMTYLNQGQQGCIIQVQDNALGPIVLKVGFLEDIQGLLKESRTSTLLRQLDPLHLRFAYSLNTVNTTSEFLERAYPGFKHAFSTCLELSDHPESIHRMLQGIPVGLSVSRMRLLVPLQNNRLQRAQVLYLQESIQMLVHHGIVHNDIHADNIMLLPDQTLPGTSQLVPVLIDWSHSFFKQNLSPLDSQKDFTDLSNVTLQLQARAERLERASLKRKRRPSLNEFE